MAIRIDPEARRMALPVGDLVPADEADPFAPARGGLARMVAGARAHSAWGQDRLGEELGFERERRVAAEIPIDDWTVEIEGRVDGLSRGEQDGQPWLVVEELKSVVLGDAAFSALDPRSYPSYLLQLRLYLLLVELGGEVPAARLSGRLVFVNLPGGARRSFPVDHQPEGIRALVAERVRELLAEWRDQQARLVRRRELGKSLGFPFPDRRPYQEQMEAACLETFDRGDCLLVTAPPGLGKTAAALSAALAHALANDRRIFFVTSKTTEQRIVASTLARFTGAHPGLTALVLRAKSKICLNPVIACHPDFCEHARDYPAKLAASRSCDRLLELGLVEPDRVREEGGRILACPFELSLDLSERTDVVVGDFNYVFDPWVSLRRAFDEGGSEDLILVIDEAHNLLERARDYYSPWLDSGDLAQLLDLAEARPGPVYRALEQWLRGLGALFARLASEAAAGEALRDPASGRLSYPVPRHSRLVGALRAELEAWLVEYLVLRHEGRALPPADPVLDLAFSFLRFARVLDLEGDEFRYLYEPRPDGTARYRILCLDPSRHLRRRLDSFHAVVAMSATLDPPDYYRDLLGFPPERTASLSLGSPFPRDHRRVMIVPTISTVYAERARHYGAVAETLRELVEARPGHWLSFFPSFAYLGAIRDRLGRLPGELLVQTEGMSDGERAAILARLERPDGQARLLLGVLGGAFAEGVDLPGEAVVGVVVVSPGLPQVSLDRQLIQERLEDRFGRGFDYAFLVPGMSRVIQAAGRLLRGEGDRGVVVLLDRRFASPRYSRYLPRDWYERSPAELLTRDPAGEVLSFFAGEPPE